MTHTIRVDVPTSSELTASLTLEAVDQYAAARRARELATDALDEARRAVEREQARLAEVTGRMERGNAAPDEYAEARALADAAAIRLRGAEHADRAAQQALDDARADARVEIIRRAGNITARLQEAADAIVPALDELLEAARHVDRAVSEAAPILKTPAAERARLTSRLSALGDDARPRPLSWPVSPAHAIELTLRRREDSGLAALHLGREVGAH